MPVETKLEMQAGSKERYKRQGQGRSSANQGLQHGLQHTATVASRQVYHRQGVYPGSFASKVQATWHKHLLPSKLCVGVKAGTVAAWPQKLVLARKAMHNAQERGGRADTKARTNTRVQGKRIRRREHTRSTRAPRWRRHGGGHAQLVSGSNKRRKGRQRVSKVNTSALAKPQNALALWQRSCSRRDE